MEYNEYIEFIKGKHAGQTRKQGTPFYKHPAFVAKILEKKGFSVDYQIAGLFHDLIEDTKTTYEELLGISNPEIVNAVRLVTKEEGYEMKKYIDRIKKNDMARMVKLADRLHNLTEAHYGTEKFQQKYIKETKQWYLDLAKETPFEKNINEKLKELENLQQER